MSAKHGSQSAQSERAAESERSAGSLRPARDATGDAAPLVSVIVPTYNRRALISRAVQSVLSQTYTNVEVIVVDDGSTDDTRDVLSRIESTRVTVLSHDNRGRSASRNAGLDRCTGRYVSFLDDDDELLPRFLEALVPVLERDVSLDVAFCRAYRQEGSRRSPTPAARAGQPLYVQFFAGNFVPNMCFLYRRSAVADIRFDTAPRYDEDFAFTMRIMTLDNVACIDETLAVYHFHEHNTTTLEPLRVQADELRVIAQLYDKHSGEPALRSEVLSSFAKKYKHVSRRLRKASAVDLLSDVVRSYDRLGASHLRLRLRLARDRRWLARAGNRAPGEARTQ